MKSLLIFLSFAPLLVFGQCDPVEMGILRAVVQGDTVVLKNDTAYRNCGSEYLMEISKSNDTIFYISSGYWSGYDLLHRHCGI